MFTSQPTHQLVNIKEKSEGEGHGFKEIVIKLIRIRSPRIWICVAGFGFEYWFVNKTVRKKETYL